MRDLLSLYLEPNYNGRETIYNPDYRLNDVLTIVQLLNRYRGQELFLEGNIEFTPLVEIG